MLTHQIHLKPSVHHCEGRHLLTLLRRYLVVSTVGALLLAGLRHEGIAESTSLALVLLFVGAYVAGREWFRD